jgi:hypothetical protein
VQSVLDNSKDINILMHVAHERPHLPLWGKISTSSTVKTGHCSLKKRYDFV